MQWVIAFFLICYTLNQQECTLQIIPPVDEPKLARANFRKGGGRAGRRLEKQEGQFGVGWVTSQREGGELEMARI